MRFLQELREQGVTAELVKLVYDAYAPDLQALQSKYERYTTRILPIHNRDYGDMDSPAIESKLNNDFFSEIVDLKVGHFAGKPASYSYDKTRAEYEKAYELLSRYQVVNNIAHIDAQTTKDAAICGKAYRLLYVDPEQELRVMTLKPYEVVTIYENEPAESEFAFRFYAIEDVEGKLIVHAAVYDSAEMHEFVLGDEGFTFKEKRYHLFNRCPVIMYLNNDEALGDADNVLALIDAYDRTLSDMNAEITAFRLAYLVLVGAQFKDREEVKAMRKSGAFELPKEADMKFLAKQLLDTPIENHLNRLEANIYQFSKTPNMRDERFASNSSGVAMKYKLSNIESKCLTFERIKVHSDIQQFKVAASWWAKKERAVFDAYSMIIEHYRNVPIDMLEIANSMKEFVAMGIPLEYLLTKMAFIDDPEYVQELIEQAKRWEQPERIADSYKIEQGNEEELLKE